MQYTYKIQNLPKSEIEISVEAAADSLADSRTKAIKAIQQNLEVDGFRKGMVPEKMVVEKIGEDAILEEAAEIVINEVLPRIFDEIKKDTIGRPSVSLQKVALGNPLEFKVRIAVVPEFEVPDYKKIAKDVLSKEDKDASLEVSEKEIEDVILQIRKNKAHFDWHQANPNADHHNHPDLDKEESLPEFNDEFAKAAGNFKDAAELREKIKENVLDEKKARIAEKKRVAIMEELVNKTKMEIPEVLVESEIAKSLAQMKDDVAHAGGDWEEYLKHVKKTEEDMRKDLRDGSEKKAKIQLIFNEIAKKEDLKLNPAILENEVKNIMEHYPGASEENARVYVETLMLNSEVLKLLDSQKA
jgi:FKBP-type peptidyl-prolyl cis-trans isomerase (trigger factor)